jgi:hypothetical protein
MGSSETLVFTCKATAQLRVSEDYNMNLHRSPNVKYYFSNIISAYFNLYFFIERVGSENIKTLYFYFFSSEKSELALRTCGYIAYVTRATEFILNLHC